MMTNMTEERMKMVLWTNTCLTVAVELQHSGGNGKKEWRRRERWEASVKRREETSGGMKGWEVSLSPVSAAGLQTSTLASKITEITWKEAWGRVDYTNNPPQHLFQPCLSQRHNSTLAKFSDFTFNPEWDVAEILWRRLQIETFHSTEVWSTFGIRWKRRKMMLSSFRKSKTDKRGVEFWSLITDKNVLSFFPVHQ